MSGNGRWTCPSCKVSVETPYCASCGEAVLHPHDLTLRGLSDQILAAVSQVDARLIRSLRCLIARPGQLTVAYLQGQRKPYLLPLPLFLVANVMFFAVQSLTTANIFSTPLDAHLHTQIWSGLAQQLVTQRLETIHSTLALYAPIFDQSVLLNAKSLIILMALAFAAFPPVLFHASRKPFVAHVVFSLHLYAFLLLLFCLALIVVEADVLLGGAGLESENLDHAMSIALLIACTAYLYAAAGIVYGGGRVVRAVKASVLSAAVALIVLGYRFVLLPITLYST